MGFWDNFFNIIVKNRNSTLPLPEGAKDVQLDEKTNHRETKEDAENVDIKIFASKKDDNIIYSVNMNSPDGRVIPLGQIYCKEDDERKKTDTLALKEITREIQDAIGLLNKANNEIVLENTKKLAKARLEKITTKYLQFNIASEAIEYIDSYTPHETKYTQLSKLPKMLDMKNISDAEILTIGGMLLERLNALDEINTPEDAYNNKESLISFMLQKEDIPTNPIVDASVESMEKGIALDENTVIEIAKNMEQINNEDGALYSAYLKLEEKRILKRMQKTLLEHSEPKTKGVTQEKYGIFKYLESQIKEIQGGFSPQVLEFIINSMKEIDIEIYTKKYKQKDKDLITLINQQYPNIKDKDEMLRYLYARIGSLGQLYYKDKTGNRMVLRNFVANTEFKDPDNTESKEFLLLVAQTEKEYIKTEYNEIIQEYTKRKSKHLDNKTFKERIGVDTTPVIRPQVENEESRDSEKMVMKDTNDFEKVNE